MIHSLVQVVSWVAVVLKGLTWSVQAISRLDNTDSDSVLLLQRVVRVVMIIFIGDRILPGQNTCLF